MKRDDIIWALLLARNCGVRMEEGTALTKTQIIEALANSYLSLYNTKNGIKRDISLDSSAKMALSKILQETSSERIFVTHGRNHQQAKKSIQNWIANNRGRFSGALSVMEEQLDHQDNTNLSNTNQTNVSRDQACFCSS
ncbi:hypothetical protein [Alkalihalobacterium alkalinitrilicum]|uniref:hypothetical protein n=1 Tax=Alkalihalobacterium alkalinitrilicum TaxID=427920 RepID=UPI000995A18A|nr:hypothetical protein [Alkalihalobacterium alkalinitrilicum]